MKLEIPIDTMRRILGGTIRTISKDETRAALSCLYVEASGLGLTVVSTDGHRLARFSCMLPYEADGSGKVLLPLSLVKELHRAIKRAKHGAVRIDTDDRTVFVMPDGVLFKFPENDAEYAPYQQIMPKYRSMGEDRAGLRWFGVNGHYVADAAAAFDDAADRAKNGAITIEFGEGELDPCVITSESAPELQIVCMPCRGEMPYKASTSVHECALCRKAS